MMSFFPRNVRWADVYDGDLDTIQSEHLSCCADAVHMFVSGYAIVTFGKLVSL